MVKAAYAIIFAIIKKIRGLPLEDLPDNWIGILQTFDQRQNLDIDGLRMAELLLKETSGYLRLIGAIDGKDCPKYVVASLTIASNALQIMEPIVERTCIKASIIDLKLHNQMDLFHRICESQIMLQQIAKLYMIDETLERLNEMKNNLTIAEEKVNIFLASS